MSASDVDALGVGPVLHSSPYAQMVAAAIIEDDEEVIVNDRGGYLRVLSPRVCRLFRATLEATIGSPMRFPGDLEVSMASFAGRMCLTEHGAIWWLAGESTPEPPGPPENDAVR